MKRFAVFVALSAALLITPAFAQHHEWHGQHGTGAQHRMEMPGYGGFHNHWRGYGYRGYGYGGYGRSSGCWAWDGLQWVWAC